MREPKNIEFAMESEAPPEVDVSSIPMEERVVHKQWKIRKEAYEELGRKFECELDANAEIFSTFGLFNHNHTYLADSPSFASDFVHSLANS